MDPLTDIVALLRPRAAFSKPITGRGRWGVRYESHPTPSFCIVQTGRCWLTLENHPPRLLEHGDFLLLPLTPAFTLASELGADCVPGRPSRNGVRHGDPKGAPDFRMIGGTFEVDHVNAALLELMAQPIHVRAAEFDTSRLTRMIGLILDEYGSQRPGRETILQHFLEAMLVEALRWPCLTRQSASPGLIAGLRDAAISRTLQAMHADVGSGWTVAGLAKRAGMSRSAFAAHFAATVGCAPMEYLSRWRMSLAQDALNRGGKSLDHLALEIGYQSASAFSTAFRKRLGCAPGAFARQARQSVEQNAGPARLA
ncbi:MAG: AraC family transcriptional regulator [Acidobacteria bacterium]|nr:AraC family transcriptional regulator [Acidobacteriota bacterium]